MNEALRSGFGPYYPYANPNLKDKLNLRKPVLSPILQAPAKALE